MKNMFITLLFLGLLISCKNLHSNINKPESQSTYNVYKIDSINNYYLIYAKKHDSIFKIVSLKEQMSDCNKIKKGLNYNFKLHSIRENAPTIGGIKMSPINYMDINCYQFDEETSICKEEGIDDLFFSDNIKSLCIIKD